MSPDTDGPVLCRVCNHSVPAGDALPGAAVRGPIAEMIRKDHPGFGEGDYVCLDDLDRYRNRYVREALETEKGELSALEAEVVESLREQEILTRNLNEEFEGKLTVGERIADRVAEFGGSWAFILSFGGIILVWIAVNTLLLVRKPFDPYPFILLNLCLSCLAALQAPVIMMSQNRQEAKDRLRAEQDFQTNLKAELEVRALNTKMDQLIAHQWQRLLEIQQIQMEMMEELIRATNRKNPANEGADAPPPPESG
jgi:uncharacterized membrane protein